MESVAAIIEALAEAHVYLRIVKQRLRKGNLAHLTPLISSSVAVNSDVANSDVAQLLMSIAEQEEGLEDAEGVKGCDMIALAIHGRKDLKRWMMGSVTERLLGATKLPLLIVRSASMRNDISRANHWVPRLVKQREQPLTRPPGWACSSTGLTTRCS